MKSVIRTVPTKNPLHNKGRGFYYEHLETGDKYACLAGGFAWPGLTSPGFLVVVGVRWPVDEDQGPIFMALDEVENHGVIGLLNSCVPLERKYSHTWDLWYGCAKHGNKHFVDEFNKSHGSLDKRGVIVTDPLGIDQPNYFEVLIRTIHELLQVRHDGSKGMILSNCNVLRGHLSNPPPEAVFKGTAELYPAIAALGYTVCSLKAYRPWAHVPGQVFVERDLLNEAAYGREITHSLDPSERISTIESEGEYDIWK